MTRQEDIWVNNGKRSCHAVRPGTVSPLESRRCLNKIVFRLSKHRAVRATCVRSRATHRISMSRIVGAASYY